MLNVPSWPQYFLLLSPDGEKLIVLIGLFVVGRTFIDQLVHVDHFLSAL